MNCEHKEWKIAEGSHYNGKYECKCCGKKRILKPKNI